MYRVGYSAFMNNKKLIPSKQEYCLMGIRTGCNLNQKMIFLLHELLKESLGNMMKLVTLKILKNQNKQYHIIDKKLHMKCSKIKNTLM